MQSDPKVDDTLYVNLSLCLILYFSQPIGIYEFKGSTLLFRFLLANITTFSETSKFCRRKVVREHLPSIWCMIRQIMFSCPNIWTLRKK